MDLAHKRYITRTLGFMAVYVALNAAAIRGVFDGRDTIGSWLLSAAIAACIAGQIWATLALMKDADEFVRGLTAKRFIVASGLAMALACAWGFAEEYAHAPHMPGFMIYPMFWAFYGVTSPFIRTSR